jgi:uncharacterized protein
MIPFLRSAAVLALAVASALAADFGALQPQGYVSDFAGVVDPGARAALERYCATVEKSTGAQLALVTLPSLGGEPIEDVANLLFRKWGVGAKGRNEGILLLLVIGDRRSRLEVGYGLEPVIPDGYAGSLLRQMRPALKDQHYGDALALAAQAIGARIAQAKGVEIASPGHAPRRRQPLASLPWPLLIGGLFALFWVMGVAGRSRRYGHSSGGFLPGLILGSIAGNALGGSGHGRGGFGGYDSGDSFGGFGGGDSGGGGASSDW